MEKLDYKAMRDVFSSIGARCKFKKANYHHNTDDIYIVYGYSIEIVDGKKIARASLMAEGSERSRYCGISFDDLDFVYKGEEKATYIDMSLEENMRAGVRGIDEVLSHIRMYRKRAERLDGELRARDIEHADNLEAVAEQQKRIFPKPILNLNGLRVCPNCRQDIIKYEELAHQEGGCIKFCPECGQAFRGIYAMI